MTKKKTATPAAGDVVPLSKSTPGITELVRQFDKPTTEGKTIIELTFKECRFPLGGVGADTRFCAKPKEGASAYCGPHNDRMYAPKKPKAGPSKPFIIR